jgi:hypothetical protein
VVSTKPTPTTCTEFKQKLLQTRNWTAQKCWTNEQKKGIKYYMHVLWVRHEGSSNKCHLLSTWCQLM